MVESVLLVLSVLGPQIANQAGWFAAEVGRQPWIVQGLLRTSEGLSAGVKANMVVTSMLVRRKGLRDALAELFQEPIAALQHALDEFLSANTRDNFHSRNTGIGMGDMRME